MVEVVLRKSTRSVKHITQKIRYRSASSRVLWRFMRRPHSDAFYFFRGMSGTAVGQGWHTLWIYVLPTTKHINLLCDKTVVEPFEKRVYTVNAAVIKCFFGHNIYSATIQLIAAAVLWGKRTRLRFFHSPHMNSANPIAISTIARIGNLFIWHKCVHK